jgi:hypothetical protein
VKKKKMKKQFAIAMVAMIVLPILMTVPVMSTDVHAVTIRSEADSGGESVYFEESYDVDDSVTVIETTDVSFGSVHDDQERFISPGEVSIKTPLAPEYCISNGGSLLYEYISSVNYTKNPSGTMIITMDIFIANPTGCTYGNPCPEYDDSPEYVNAWVDWDGDNVFENHEKVIDVALTGYHDLNYYGTMTTSDIVTIPAGAETITWMRVNLGWNHDPNDPCESSWTWGDVFDEQISTETNLPQIEDITVSGPPGDESNPMTTRSVTLEATISSVSGYDINSVSWTGDGIPAGATSNPYTYTPAAGTHGIKNVQCVITYEKTATGETGQDLKTKGFKLFFVKSSDEDGDGEPNWFEHWKSDGAVPNMATALYDAASTYYGYCTGAGQVYLTPSSAGQHYSSAIVLNTHFGTESFGGPAVKGIDCAAEIIAHELYHKWVDDQWDSGGIFHGQTDSDRDINPSETIGSDTYYYRDELPDSYEDATSHTRNDHTDTYDLETEKSPIYKFYGDQEYMAMKTGDGVRGDLARDWANPGKQTTPAYYSTLSLQTSIATGPVEGKFIGKNTDKGNDTDDDGLYDYLTVSSEIEVINGGIFKIVAWLKDEKGNDITFINKPLVLETGMQEIMLNFDGLAIRKHGADGTFNVTMLLSDEYGNEVDHQDYTTSAYKYREFQEPHAEFTGKYYDYATDTDYDKLYNYLNVDVGVHIRTSGKYTIKGWLYDSKGKGIIMAKKTTHLNVGDQTVTLNFDGSAIRQHRADGPYCLAYLTLSDEKGNEIEFIHKAYETRTYKYQAFQRRGAEFTGAYESYGKDPNRNKFYDFLAIDAGVRVFTPGKYTVAGWLYDKDGNCLCQAHGDYYLSRDSSFVTLDFSGKPIYKHGTNGPYYLKYITLYNEKGIINDQQHDAHATSAYNYKLFQPLVLMTGSYSDYGEDTDEDGFHDNLMVCAEVLTSGSGHCAISARLMDRNGREILWAHGSSYLTGNKPQEVCINFDGRYIYANMMDGPYYVRDVYIYHTGDANVPDYVSEAYTTAAYSSTDFEKSGIITGEVTNMKGEPIPNALVSIEDVDYDYTDNDGKYILTILQSGTYTVEVEPPVCMGVLGDSAKISITAGKKVVHDFVLPPAKQLPDLVIASKVESWVDEEEKGTYTVSYVIQNKGAITAPAGHYTTLYIDGEAVEHKLVPVDLKPCQKYVDTFTMVVECTPPEDKIWVCADNHKQIEEANEYNNCLTNVWGCEVEERKPDLEVEKKWESWVDQEKGTYVVHCIIHNNGTISAPAGHYTTLYIDGEAVEHKLVPVELEPCQKYEDTFTAVVECTPPEDRVWVCADNYNTIDESDENDNCVRNTWECPVPVKKPDLVITDISRSDNRIIYGIKNQGNAAAGPSTTYLYVDGSYKARDSIGSMPAGGTLSRSFEYAYTCTPPRDTIKVCADATKKVTESNEANNCKTEVWTCEAPPTKLDIYFADAKEWPGSVYHYDTTTGIEETVYTRPSRQLFSFTFHPGIPEKLYYVNAIENKIYRTHQTGLGWAPEEVVYTHTTNVKDIAFAFDKDGKLGLYFSEANKIYKIEDSKASLYYEAELADFADVDGFWFGDFAFDDKNNLYLSSANRVPAGIYKVEGGEIKEIFRDEKEPITGLVYEDGALYYANYGTKIYRLDLTTGERTVVWHISIQPIQQVQIVTNHYWTQMGTLLLYFQ